MTTSAHRWELLYNQTPLSDVTRHFHGIRQSPFLLQYLSRVLELCPRGGRTCETGIGSGYGAIWLSLRGILAEGIDYAPGIVERARQVNNILGGQAQFREGDLFAFFAPDAPRYHVVHHQGVLEHFTVPQIQAALAQQVALAEWVVFSVPSVYYPFDPEFGDERLLPIEEWERILAPFAISELTYYGDPNLGAKEQILCVLRGQPVDDALLALITVPEEPYPEGISVIVQTRNEERNIGPCLETVVPFASEIIVCDMESTDRTVEIARTFTDNIVLHPLIQNFDRARNVSAMRAKYRWVFCLDADERVPSGLGPALQHLIATQGETFEAALVPFRHFFCGRWMQCLYPGYTAPRLLKNGKFIFNPRLHSGAKVEGRTILFPADNPDLALVHHSFDSMAHYLEKLNRYTDGEAANMHRDGHPYHWQHAIRHFVHDFQDYYERGQATKDGVHGFIYSFLSAFYRFEQHAKLYEQRFREGKLQPQEQAIPANLREMLLFALSVADEKPLPQAPAIRVEATNAEAAQAVWSGPLWDPSGYGEESRHLLFAADQAGVPIAAQPLPWSNDVVELQPEEHQKLTALCQRPVAPGFVQIVHNFAPGFARHPEAGITIGRTLFETDRLSAHWVTACNRMDYVWVATEFNRRTFAQAGVEAKKLVVVPECLDPAPFLQPIAPSALAQQLRGESRFVFLTMFDWTLHKGWDVLLQAFLSAFEGRTDVKLILKVWSTMGYTPETLREQANAWVRQTLGHDLAADPRIQFLFDRLPHPELLALYCGVDAYALPSRGEGWGRPYMEAMACGLPTLATDWSGNTAFMHPENSYLCRYTLQDVPEIGWREIPTYQGHRWAEPEVAHVIEQMRRIVEEPAEAQAKGARAREEILSTYTREKVGALMAQEIARLQEERRPHLVLVRAGDIGNTPQERSALRTIETVRVRWEGAQFSWHSLGHVNRELCLGLLQSGRVELSLVPTEPAHFRPEEEPRFAPLASRCFQPLSQPAQIHVRHFFPPRFEVPEEGHLILIQPWEYGYLPTRWIEPILRNVFEVWCYSRYVRDVYLASGIPAEKLHIIPLGVDTEVFHPEAPPYVFTTEAGASALQDPTEERFVFLFVGGTQHRKGTDILLEAYRKAFSAYDEVCLVIKDTGTQTVYRYGNEKQKILGLVGDAYHAPIIYLDDDVSLHRMAGLYTAADCLVQPYRGEGFCLPALEAMACGVPAIVPEGGPTDDFIDATVGWRLPAEYRPFGHGKVGDWDCVGPTWMFEIAVDTLARQMRKAFQNRDEVKRKGAAAVERVRNGWTWKHSTEAILQRLGPSSPALLPAPLVPRWGEGSVSTGSESIPLSIVAPDGCATIRNRPSSKQTDPLLPSEERTPAASAPVLAPRRTREEGGRGLRVSLCMIVRNEERVLPDCLGSIKPFVDEMIIVDTGSTDRTVEIAEQFGAKVFHFPWTDSFSEARNVSLEHATGDWIFWMDADDTIPEECGRGLHELARLAEDRVTGFLIQVHIPPAPGDSGFTVVDHVKLFRNWPELRFEGRIHEQILEPIYRHGGTIERSNLYVVHSGYDYSPEGQQRKRARDLTLLEKDLADRPDHPFVLFNIGMTAYHLKEHDKAIPALDRCLEVSKPYESTVRKVYAMLTGCHLEQGNLARAKERLEQGFVLFPTDPELLFRGGILYRELGNLPAAEMCYLNLLNAPETGHIDSLDITMTTYKAHHNLALIYQDMGRLPEALAQWEAAIASNPTFAPSLMGLAELYLHLRRFDDVRAILARLQTIAPDQAQPLHQRLAQACL